MKYLILLIIQTYWNFIPQSKRKRCIFKTSCSNYVYQITKNEGFIKGIKAFIFRYKNCRGNFEIFENPISKKKQILLPSKLIIDSDEIAERFL
ncbi:membrane protein insertion efficiency factor YidD [Flavobacterium sp. MC2016-06]|uniref:membrane protein insertion efficiency factor YidD n=1 Tax=Flavobacterium sp. MC2016-06 TaxID=2676308 RepID=UPI0012BA7CBF|nr:membrane protein insertion efficiency factor YidD [Flavobacterium sp. MC2016-06]MBU3861672.1 membrane protein insertion efficiency factor YidD [Flavobacterium sp. MC2016-06]